MSIKGNTDDKQTTVYILELSNSKWYVGRTDNLEARLEAHMTGSSTSSEFVKANSPVIDFIIYSDCDMFDEDKYTKKYMAKYGIDNVRGGSYVQLKLSETQISTLTKELQNSSDACFNCGLGGHFIKYCPTKQPKKWSKKFETNVKTNVSETSETKTIVYENKSFLGHVYEYVSSVFSTPSPVKVAKPMPQIPIQRYDSRYKNRRSGFYNSMSRQPKPKIMVRANMTCFKCGMYGHSAKTCFRK